MAIEINGLNGSQSQATQQSGQSEKADASRQDTANQPANGGGHHNDTIELTNAGRQLSELESKINEQPIVDTRRVAEISRSIENGSLEINPSSIATNLIRFEAFLG
jgi:flagellar biosynthesis anti-sigma factor FlgM